MAVAIDLDAEVAGETGPVGVLDAGITTERQSLTLDGQLDAALWIQLYGVAQLQIGGIPGQQASISQAGTVIGRGVAGYLHGGFDGGADGRLTQIGSRGRSLAAIAIDSNAKGTILVEFDTTLSAC